MPESRPIAAQGLKVLIVEDEPRLRQLLCDELPEMGFAAVAARSAEQAQRILDTEPAHILLLDLNLPVMDGLTFLQRLREDRPDMPVIILTGFGSLEDAKRAIRLDVVEFLTKPAHLGEIEAALDRARRRLRPVSPPLLAHDPPTAAPADATTPLDEVERQAILRALAAHQGNRSAAAAALGISRRTLYNKLADYQATGRLTAPGDET